VWFSSSNPGVAKILGNQLRITGAGTATITAHQSGNGNYNAAGPVDQVFKVVPLNISVTANAKSKVYGDPDPSVFTYSFTPALIGGDSFSGSLSRVPGENAGLYDITVGSLAAGVNYVIKFNPAKFTISKAPLLIKADDQVMNFGGAYPAYTFTMSGFKSGDTRSTVFLNVVFTANPDRPVTVPGIYTITPSISSPLNYSPLNYTLAYAAGTLYVNPFGSGAKKIRVSLECVTPLTNSTWAYQARFSYVNDNIYPVYVKAGPDNYLVSAGQYENILPPQLFNPGSGYFLVKFDGAKLTWVLTTNDSDHKTSVASDASSTSKKCPKDGQLVDPMVLSPDQVIRVYPNPVSDFVIVTVPEEPVKGGIMVFDMLGRPQQVQFNWRGSVGMEVDLTGKPAGLYIIQVSIGQDFQRFKILKQ